VVADRELAQRIPPNQLEYHPSLGYAEYRAVLRSCQIALLPLARGVANGCKTPVKLLECGAESVAVVCGPELYGRYAPSEVAQMAASLEAVVPMAQTLARDLEQRLQQVSNAHAWVSRQWRLRDDLPSRLWLYGQIWKRRQQLDQRLVERLEKDRTLSTMQEAEFGSEAD
jgi:hypothetical protein